MTHQKIKHHFTGLTTSPLIAVVFLAGMLVSGCRNGLAMENMMNRPVRKVTVSWDNFICSSATLGGLIYGTSEPFPDKFTLEWQDSATMQMKQVELDVPKSAQGHPWGSLVILTHSNGVVEVKHSRNGKTISGYKKKITDEW